MISPLQLLTSLFHVEWLTRATSCARLAAAALLCQPFENSCAARVTRILVLAESPLTMVPVRWGERRWRRDLGAESGMVLRCDRCAVCGVVPAVCVHSVWFVGASCEIRVNERSCVEEALQRHRPGRARSRKKSSAKDAADGALHEKYEVDSAISVGSHADSPFVAKMVALGTFILWDES